MKARGCYLYQVAVVVVLGTLLSSSKTFQALLLDNAFTGVAIQCSHQSQSAEGVFLFNFSRQVILAWNLHRVSRKKSNNFRWLNAVKETKIEFFVRDNSGEKFLTAHAARRNFSEVICRACAVVIHSWFSRLHGKFCVLALRTFSWCFGVAAIKNHTPPDSCVVWCCRVRKPQLNCPVKPEA